MEEGYGDCCGGGGWGEAVGEVLGMRRHGEKQRDAA